MSAHLEAIIEKVRAERQRQFNLPGSEWDAQNSPGEWVALISHYVSKEVRAKGVPPVKEDFEQALIKAAAVIIAALENLDEMQSREQLVEN